MENRKEVIKKFREQLAGGKYARRNTLLAYAFLRGVPYVALERIIHEDHPSFDPEGRNGFLGYLSRMVGRDIAEVSFGSAPGWKRDMTPEEKEKRDQFDALSKSLGNEVFAWIQEKYKAAKDSEAAA